MKQLGYTTINERAFDFLAGRYRERMVESVNQNRLVNGFSQCILDNFSNPKVLKIGVGSGDMLRYFSKLSIKTTAIDISSKMIEVAKRKSQMIDFIYSDFISYNFCEERFPGVFADSVLHLFPRDKIEEVFDKVYSILENKGSFYISIPLFDKSKEEIIERGEEDNRVPEFRERYTERDFNLLLINTKFGLLEKSITDFEDSKGNSLSKLNALLVK